MPALPSVRSTLVDRWWEHASGVIRFSPKREGRTLRGIIARLDDVKDWGFDAIELLAPYHGGVQYSGLDVIDFFRVAPQSGTLDDFRPPQEVPREGAGADHLPQPRLQRHRVPRLPEGL